MLLVTVSCFVSSSITSALICDNINIFCPPGDETPSIGYVGDLNERGEKHGHGVFRYDNNDVYEGE